MRAARLLQILLILQNRGRQTSAQLGTELEVSTRTILRDVDAMTEAGLPIIVHQGNQGGIELGFNYRTRLTGLTQDESQALGLILGAHNPMISALGLDRAATQAKAKLVESFPDSSRTYVTQMMARFTLSGHAPQDDPRIAAMAKAIQNQLIIRLRFTSDTEQIVHPTAMELTASQWRVWDSLENNWINLSDWGRLNISARQFPDKAVSAAQIIDHS